MTSIENIYSLRDARRRLLPRMIAALLIGAFSLLIAHVTHCDTNISKSTECPICKVSQRIIQPTPAVDAPHPCYAGLTIRQRTTLHVLVGAKTTSFIRPPPPPPPSRFA